MKASEITVEMLKMRNMMSILSWEIVSEETAPGFVKVVIMKKLDSPVEDSQKE